MKKTIQNLSLLALMSASSVAFAIDVYDEATLNAAIEAANTDTSIKEIVFEKNADITLNAPVVYTGTQALTLIGKGAIIDGANAGEREEFYDEVEGLTTVKTKDGTLMFNTAANISIKHLSVVNSYTRGIVVSLPSDAEGGDINVSLQRVNILGSALYGLHIDDNDNEFDNGTTGSAIGINLTITSSNFLDNGTGAIDFDGIRVDERSEGSITAYIMNTKINHNGGDGIELDEAGNGDVTATMIYVAMNDNGFYNAEDLDDGFDIDEADEGDLNVNLVNVTVNNNQDQGLDFDEAGSGDVHALAYRVMASNNIREGVKIDEEDAGDISANLSNLTVKKNTDDGVQFTELGEGEINVSLNKVNAIKNKKYGLKFSQWNVEDEDEQAEVKGAIQTNDVRLQGNKKGDDIKIHGVIVD